MAAYAGTARGFDEMISALRTSLFFPLERHRELPEATKVNIFGIKWQKLISKLSLILEMSDEASVPLQHNLRIIKKYLSNMHNRPIISARPSWWWWGAWSFYVHWLWMWRHRAFQNHSQEFRKGQLFNSAHRCKPIKLQLHSQCWPIESKN